MTLLHWPLLPFSWLYGGILRVRHFLYDQRILKSHQPEVPTIVIGNLALGGTGKTPHVELVLRELEASSPLATLSRGYGRKGTGFKAIKQDDDPSQTGDEPLQIKRKFPNVHVFAGADRVEAIKRIQPAIPELKAVVLDDAFQHRKLKGGLNILLTTWQRPWTKDALIPAGSLRDLPTRARNAQIVIVTKCPAPPTEAEQQRWRKELGLQQKQELFFSGIEYEAMEPLRTDQKITLPDDPDGVLLFTGIADPAPLVQHLKARWPAMEHVRFPDHHDFSPKDLHLLAKRFSNFVPGRNILVTTEKDAVRLLPKIKGGPLDGLPIAVIGMRAVLLNGHERFGALIRQHVG